MAVKRILRYLQKTSKQKLTFKKSGGNLHASCDSDWVGDLDYRKSTAEYIFLSSGEVISWAPKKQPTVALSTILLAVIGIEHITPITIFCDNKGQHKPIDIKHHFIRATQEAGQILITSISSEKKWLIH